MVVVVVVGVMVMGPAGVAGLELRILCSFMFYVARWEGSGGGERLRQQLLPS
jgi:hypothetical protein